MGSPDHPTNPPPVRPTTGAWLRKPGFRLALGSATVVVVFAPTLLRLAAFASGSSLYSHTILIPVASVLLAWVLRLRLPSTARPAWLAGTASLLGAALTFAITYVLARASPAPAAQDLLFGSIVAFVVALGGAGFLTVGAGGMRTLALPAVFLFWMAPFPTAVETALETFLQRFSADAAHGILLTLGAPVFREGLVFHLPGISLEVARECSGIHSSLVLFIVSLVAGRLFLRRGVSRLALALAVIPLAIARNGVRVATLALLCIHGGPTMIDTPLHHQGGPVFFAASLIPFSLFLLLLRRLERRDRAAAPTPFPR